jgi:hypothetical protein
VCTCDKNGFWRPDNATLKVYIQAVVGLAASAMMWVAGFDLLVNQERENGQLNKMTSWKNNREQVSQGCCVSKPRAAELQRWAGMQATLSRNCNPHPKSKRGFEREH